jgi:hypothetical protein
MEIDKSKLFEFKERITSPGRRLHEGQLWERHVDVR